MGNESVWASEQGLEAGKYPKSAIDACLLASEDLGET
jgi:hypothetical protein